MESWDFGTQGSREGGFVVSAVDPFPVSLGIPVGEANPEALVPRAGHQELLQRRKSGKSGSLGVFGISGKKGKIRKTGTIRIGIIGVFGIVGISGIVRKIGIIRVGIRIWISDLGLGFRIWDLLWEADDGGKVCTTFGNFLWD